MRGQRIEFLEALGAEEARAADPDRRPVRRQGRVGGAGVARPKPQVAFAERPVRRFRVRYAKLGRLAFLGHLDTARVLMRLLRRAGIEVAYTRGFHPKPSFTFAPALSLGVNAMAELFDLDIEAFGGTGQELLARIEEVAPEGLVFTGCWELDETSRSLAQIISAYDLVIRPAVAAPAEELAAIARRFLALDQALVVRGPRHIDVRARVTQMEVLGGAASARLLAALDWEEAPALVRARVEVGPGGLAKPIEVAQALGLAGGESPAAPRCRLVRLGFVASEQVDAGAADGVAGAAGALDSGAALGSAFAAIDVSLDRLVRPAPPHA